MSGVKYYTVVEDWTTQKGVIVESVSYSKAIELSDYGITTYDTKEDALKFCTPRLVKVRVTE